jgi:hypothetical protein
MCPIVGTNTSAVHGQASAHWNATFSVSSVCILCSYADTFLRDFQPPKRPDTPRQRSPAPLHADNENTLVMKDVSEIVEEDITSEDASAIVREKRVSKESTPEPATTEQKARSKKKMTKVKKGWNRMLRLFSNKAEDREARRRREMHDTHQRWHRAQTALSSSSAFFNFESVTQNALGGVRYSIPTPARSRECVARLASRSTLYITDGSTPPPLPIRRDRRIEPAEPQSEASSRRRKNEWRPSDEKKRACS